MPVETAVNIPVVDFSPFLGGSLEGKQTVAQAIYRACHEVGFIYLKNHGIPQIAIAEAFEQSKQFFALPLAKKQSIAWSGETSNRGYVG
ncbi:MAG: 2-oxoglutarate and iron-dependent oxygenase domain-containing protein, partial [Pseudomonadota bacterium]